MGVQRSRRSESPAYVAAVDAISGPANVFLEVLGSATKTVRVLEVAVQPSAAADVTIERNSTAHTGGTSASPALVKADTNSAAATAVVKTYTVAQTGGGTLVGVVGRVKIAADGLFVWRPGDEDVGERGTLRGAAEAFTFASDAAVTWRGHVVFAEE